MDVSVSLGELLERLRTLISREADENTDNTDDILTADEVRVVRLLEAHDGMVRQSQIADEFGWSASKTSRLLTRMENIGIVARTRIGREKAVFLPDRAPSIHPGFIPPEWIDIPEEPAPPLHDEPVPDEERVILILEHQDGPVWQSAIQEQLGWSSSKTSRILAELEEAGRIERHWYGRAKVVTLTDHPPQSDDCENLTN